MASFVDVCRFTAVSSGTGNFVVSAAVTGYQTPAAASATSGATYRYRAESADLSQWEIGEGVYTSGSTTLARTTIFANSSGGTSAINFSAAPQVAIVALARDIALRNSAVSGASTTYTAAQGNVNVQRSNSGSAMADTLPGTGSFLPANTVVTVTNSDASALLSIVAASGATIKGNTFNGFLYLGPGQTVALLSDGTDYWPIGYPSRVKLGANTSIHVATTGNNTTNSGIVTGSSFLTTNRAWAFAQSCLDLNGYVLTIQHAAGTYSTNTSLTGFLVGQSGPASVLIQGDLSTPTNCAMPGTGSGVTIGGDLGAQFQIQGFAISSSGGQGIRSGPGSIINYQTCSFGVTSGSTIAAVSGGVVQVVGNYTITTGTHSTHWNANAGGRIVVAAAMTLTLSGTPAFSQQFALAQTAGVIFFDFTPTYSGSATGVRWSAVINGTINTGGVSFPGDTSGSALTGGQFN